METLWQDLGYGLRRLAKQPAFTFVALLSLAIGIGANSAIFSVANALLLRPLPYKDADRLVILWNRSPGLNVEKDWFSLGQYLDIRAENRVFEDVALTIGATYNLTGQGTPEHIEAAHVSSSLFPLLGAEAALGRVLLAEDDEKNRPPTAVLSHGFWQRRFGGDPAILGQTLILNDKPFTIVGVLPARFTLTKEVMPTVNGIQRAEVFLPLPLSESDRTKRGGEDYNIFARLKDGVTVAEAQADMDRIAEQMKREYPEAYPAHGQLTLGVVPLLEEVVGDIRLALYVLLGAVGFVLLIACADVANLLLSRAAVRQKEIAIRAAIGASRQRILRQLLTESLLLAVGGGLLGLGLAFLLVEALRVFGPESIPRLNEIIVDGRVLAFTFSVSLLTGLLFGLAPAWRASRVDLNEVLKEGGRTSGGALAGTHRLRGLLIVAQVALSLVLLIGAGLLVRSYQRIAEANPGFEARNVLSLRLSIPASRYPTPESVFDFYKRLSERVESLPGVETTATSYLLPLSANAVGWEPITVEGYVPRAGDDLIISNSGAVSAGYFRTMGIPLTRGRYFDEGDVQGAPEVVIVDERLAARFWPNEDPIGKRIRRGRGGPWRKVVGVVREEKAYSPEREPPIKVYFPIEQVTPRSRYLVARVASNPEGLMAAVAREIRALDAELPVYDARTMEQRLYDSLARRRFSMLLLGVFAGFALVLAAVGIYGVMSYWVNKRRHEIGVRMALGAPGGAIRRLVIGQAMKLAAIGIGLGLLSAFALTRLMSNLLFGIGATDRVTFLLIPALLGVIAFLAAYVPARRASRVDPMVALRYE